MPKDAPAKGKKEEDTKEEKEEKGGEKKEEGKEGEKKTTAKKVVAEKIAKIEKIDFNTFVWKTEKKAERVYPKRKIAYKAKIDEYAVTYKNCILVGIDNVGSKQIQDIRIALRGKGVLLFGKNTMARNFLQRQAEANPKLRALIERVKGNTGFLFTNMDTKVVRDLAISFIVPAPARLGGIAPNDVVIPPGPTGQDPGQTSFFQSMEIPTKIFKGAIEITQEVRLIKKGDKVTASQVALLSKLNIRPFSYGLTAKWIYEDGDVYAASVLDLSNQDILQKFQKAGSMVKAIAKAANYPITPLVPSDISSAWSKILALSLSSGYEFKRLESIKKAMAAAPAPAAAAPKTEKKEEKGGKKKEEKKEEPKKEEKKEEEEADMGMSLFG